MVAAVVLLACGSLLAPSPVLAAGAPEWIVPPEPETVLKLHSTRVILEMVLRSNKLDTKWTSEVAVAECGGPVPTEGWKSVGSGEFSGSKEQVTGVFLGGLDPGESAGGAEELRHLKPGTCYDARFSATNADSNGQPAVAVVPFKTLPVEQPEVPKGGEVEEGLESLFTLPEVTDTSVAASAKIESNGAESEYSFEYSLPENGHAPSQGSALWKPFSSGATGKVTTAEDFRQNVKAATTGLSPETTYYVRIKLTNSQGTFFQTKYGFGSESFTTGSAKPGEPSLVVRNVTGSSAHLHGAVAPRGSETLFRFESAPPDSGGACPSPSGGGWSLISGSEGTISQAQAEATSYFNPVSVGVSFVGLSKSTLYCLRLSASNAAGNAEPSTASFETEGPPSVETFAVHRLVDESLQLLGTVNPNSVPTSAEQSVTLTGATGGTFTLTIGGHTTGPIAYDAPAAGTGSVQETLSHLPGEAGLEVEGVAGGPYTVWFGTQAPGVAQPLIEADGTGLTPSPGSSVAVATVQAGGESSDTQYWFQYVSEQAFAEHGWESPEETPHAPSPFGHTPQLAGILAPGLKSGEGYRFRLLAQSSLSGSSPVVGGEQALTVPALPAGATEAGCPNEAFRTGLAAPLPDCRAYEQVTPLEKGAAQEPFHYRGGIQSAVLVGEDGEHATLEAPEVQYGSSQSSGQSPYLFSRGEGGWSMTAGAPQPETGLDSVTPQVYSADLTQIAFESFYAASEHSESPEAQYKLGMAGGPYRTVASVPRMDLEEARVRGEPTGWVAGSGDFSKLVLETSDHELLGSETGTGEGSDLYEYTTAGLRQLNVTGSGGEAVTIGTCGARMVNGEEGSAVPGGSNHNASSSHAISVDGLRVFFEAVPGKNCSSEAKHLYMRVNGAETVDIGAYRFVAASPDGTELLVKTAGGELLGYDTSTKAFVSRSAGELAEEQELSFLEVPARFEPEADNAFARSRYTFWAPQSVDGQAFRYDRVEHVLECVSCASSFASEPKNSAYLGDVEGLPEVNGGLPDFSAVSANGEFAFFTTVSALVRQDVDQEVLPEFNGDSGEYINVGGHTSPSTDVYEWRAAGVDGCALVQGCLALITDGRGGYLNLLLGTADEGRDVFIYTRSVLSPASGLPEGSIGEGNVYDVRVDGGFPPPPPRATECEADACSTAPPAPNDPTPSSLTFSGAGNLLAPLPAPVIKPKLAGAQPLVRALRVCRKKHDKRRRAVCERQARTKYGPIRAKKKAERAANTAGSAGAHITANGRAGR